jgi:heptosyltransferase III
MSTALELKKLIDRAIGVPLLHAAAVARRAGAPAPPKEVRRVLLVKLWGLGNLAMMLPIAAALKQRDPTVVVDLLTLDGNREFATPCPHLDHVLTLETAGVPLRSIAQRARELRTNRYDLILDGEQFLRLSALLVAYARPRFSVGFRTRGQHRHALYDKTIECTPRRHMLHLFRDLARAGGIPLAEHAEHFVPRSAAARRRVRDRLAEWRDPRRPLVVMHPGSGDNFIGRRWPLPNFARLSDLLTARDGAQVVFTGNSHERSLVVATRRLTNGPSVDLAGRLSILEFVELLALADLVVTNDTAPAHFAAALGRPQVAFYGPNSPALYGPLSNRAELLYTGLACSPCLLNTNAKSSFCRVPLCMRAIDPLAAYSAARRALDGTSRPAIAARLGDTPLGDATIGDAP